MMNAQRTRLLAAMGGRQAFRDSFDARTMRCTDRRVDMELESAEASTAQALTAIDAAARRAGFTDPDALARLKGEWVQRFERAWIAYQHAGARTLNWMVTGPARFPVARNQKRLDTEDKRLGEMLELVKGAGEWARKRIRRQVEAELGPVGVADREFADARRRLEARERRQAMMKAANAAIRKHRKSLTPAVDVAAELEAAGYAEITARVAAELLKPNCFGGVGFEAYQLSNNNAEIRRLRARVAELERKAAAIAAAAEAEPVEQEDAGDGVRIVENVLEQRVQILFPDRPSAELRTALKRRGFRWSPRAGAWQRQLTPQAVEAARAIVN